MCAFVTMVKSNRVDNCDNYNGVDTNQESVLVFE